MKIGCVILAGGKSSRMQRDKALLTINNLSFIETIMQEANFFEEKYVARADKDPIKKEGWIEIEDLYKDRGPIGGLHSTLHHCKSDAMFAISCDCPCIKESFIKAFCEQFDEEYDAIIAKDETGKIHPLCAIYKKRCAMIFEEQIKSGCNRIMKAFDQMKVKYIFVESKLLRNVNTPQEYEALKQISK